MNHAKTLIQNLIRMQYDSSMREVVKEDFSYYVERILPQKDAPHTQGRPVSFDYLASRAGPTITGSGNWYFLWRVAILWDVSVTLVNEGTGYAILRKDFIVVCDSPNQVNKQHSTSDSKQIKVPLNHEIYQSIDDFFLDKEHNRNMMVTVINKHLLVLENMMVKLREQVLSLGAFNYFKMLKADAVGVMRQHKLLVDLREYFKKI